MEETALPARRPAAPGARSALSRGCSPVKSVVRATERVIIDLPADIAAIEEVVERAVEYCAPAWPERDRLRFNFRVGLTEALSNAILFGGGGDRDRSVRVELRVGSGEVRARVSDRGGGFDPEAVPDPRLPENLAKPSGRGVFLMRALMDEVRFNEAGNEVTLVKRRRS